MPKVSPGLAAIPAAVSGSSEDFGRRRVVAVQSCPGLTDIGAPVLDAKSRDDFPALLIGVQATRTPCGAISASRTLRKDPDWPFWSSDDSPRTHCSGRPPATGHGRHPARQSQPGEVSRAAKPRTQARPSLGSVADSSGRLDDTGNPNLYGKGCSEKNAAAPNGAAANTSAAFRPDALQLLAGVSVGLCLAPKLPTICQTFVLRPVLPTIPTTQLPATSRSALLSRGP